MTHPACFDSDEQHIGWVQADRQVQVARKYHPSPICVDCTPEHAERMRACGRCEHPQIAFKRDHRGELVGFDPTIEDDEGDMAGVTFNKNAGKWCAKIWSAGRYRNVGYFVTKQEAKQARIDALSHKRVAEAA